MLESYNHMKQSEKSAFFEKLVKAYSTDLFRYGYWLSKDRTVAEDLVQETFLRAWRAIESLKNEKAAKSWLITILRRENARRFEKKRPILLEINDEILEDEHTLLQTELIDQELLYKAMQKLPVEFSEPLILQVIWGFSGIEIADQLDMKLATVNTRLFRARKQLQKIYLGKDGMSLLRQEGAGL
jgi:RNA polymerase sigma-70 factor (ECF subfamily)